MHPAMQVACAHGSDRCIEHAEQGGVATSGNMTVQLKVASGRGVHGHRLVGAFHRQSAQVWQCGLLCLLDIGQQAAGGTDGQIHSFRAESGEIAGAEESAQFTLTALSIEMPDRALAQTTQAGNADRPSRILGDQRFRGLQSGKFRIEFLNGGDFAEQEATAAEVHPGQAVSCIPRGDGQQQVVAAFLQQRLIGDGAGSDDAHDLAFNQSLGQCRIADLFADGDGFSLPDQACQVGLGSVIRNACHRNGLARRGAALGQGDVQQSCRLARIVVEQLVEVAHAEEQQHVRMRGLGSEKLAHEGRVLGELAHQFKPVQKRRLSHVRQADLHHGWNQGSGAKLGAAACSAINAECASGSRKFRDPPWSANRPQPWSAFRAAATPAP